MKLRNTKIIFVIEDNAKIRHEVFQFEDTLKKAFKIPFRINNVPDEADPNIIRFQASSLNSFSKLQVTQNKIILETNYDKNYENDLVLIKNYLIEKIKILEPVISKEKLKYVGILSLLDNEMKVEEILPLIKSETNFSLIDNKIIELRYQYKKRYQEKYILKVDVSPYTRYQVKITAKGNKFEKEPLRLDSRGLQIKLDFNNNISSNIDTGLDIVIIYKILDDFINLISKNTLNNFIKGLLL